jgi:uncharacterized membrane protein
MKKFSLCMLGVSVMMAIGPKVLAGGAPSFTTIDVPGAGFTIAIDINFNGQIVGRYNDATGTHGYLLSKGSFTTVDFPGAQSYALGLNWQADIVGLYFDGSKQHGYLFSGGVFSTVDFPGSASSEANGINAAGDIVGTYLQNANGGGKEHGFLLHDGVFTAIDVPGASDTEAARINDNGVIAGRYRSGNGQWHLYLLVNGSFTSIDFPGAVQTVPGGFNPVCGLNNRLDMASDYCNSSTCVLNSIDHLHGFVFSGGAFTAFDPPGAVGTVAYGINDRGYVVGGFHDANLAAHGYIRKP